jgi:hypothetical protein
MTNKGNIAVVGGQGTSSSKLYYRNPDTAATSSYRNAAVTVPNNIRQIEYISSSTTWVAAMDGTTVTANNSIAYSTAAQRVNDDSWTNIQTVNTNVRVCVGVAAAR